MFHWSGGKDSTLALHYALQDSSITIKYLLTTFNKAYRRIAIHGVSEELLKMQAESIGIPLIVIELPELPSMDDYETMMQQQMLKLRAIGITYSIFGDIFLADLKQYLEKQMAAVGISCLFPLWQRDTRSLITDFLNLGYQTILVCVNDELKYFCGRIVDENFVAELPAHVDACGENGEFHTFAFGGPIFQTKIEFRLGERIHRTFPNPDKEKRPIGFWYQDLIP